MATQVWISRTLVYPHFVFLISWPTCNWLSQSKWKYSVFLILIVIYFIHFAKKIITRWTKSINLSYLFQYQNNFLLIMKTFVQNFFKTIIYNYFERMLQGASYLPGNIIELSDLKLVCTSFCPKINIFIN